MKTDMTFDEMKSFFSYLSNGIPQIDTLTLEGSDDMSTGIYYYLLDQESLEETQHILKSHLGLIPDTSDISGTMSGTNNNLDVTASENIQADTYNSSLQQ